MQRIDAFIRRDAALHALLEQTRQLTALQGIWTSVIPSALRSHTQAGGMTARRLTVFADSGAVAAKLKLLAPGLLQGLQQKGVDADSIRVAVRANVSTKPGPKPGRRISARAAENLRGLAETLEDSPLRDALKRLAQQR